MLPPTFDRSAAGARPQAALAALLVAVAALFFLPAASGSAWAASCTCQPTASGGSTAAATQSPGANATDTPARPVAGKLLKSADTVVTGTVAAVDDTVTPAQFTVTLDRIYRGSIATASVSFAQDPGCPLKNLTVGERWVVAAHDAEGTDVVPIAIACNVSGPATKARLKALERNFGTGSAPVSPKPPKPTLTTVETVAPQRFTRLAAPGAAMFVIGLLGFIGVRRLGRSKP